MAKDRHGVDLAAYGQVRERLGRTLGYVGRLRDRLHRHARPPDDPLLRAAGEAYNGLHGLLVALHYESCPGGICRGSHDRAADWRGDGI